MSRDLLAEIDPRSLRLLAVGSLVLLVTAMALYLIKPLWLEYQAIKSSNQVLNQAMAYGTDLDKQLEQRKVNMHKLEEQLFGSSGAIPAKQMESYVIGILQSISWGQRVKLNSVKPMPNRDILQFRESPFEVSLSGDYFDLYHSLQAINSELGFIVIDKFIIQSDSLGKPGGILQMKLRMANYRILN
jgi:type IV pilus assembly protein PilO